MHSVSFFTRVYLMVWFLFLKYLILETFTQLIAKFNDTACFRMFAHSSQTLCELADQPSLFSWKRWEWQLLHIMIFFQSKTVTALHGGTRFTAEPKSKLNLKVFWLNAKFKTSLTCVPLFSESVYMYWLVWK